ncbi:MAG TPA: hypothetical protein VFX96_05560, partial [Pyrinomonadaceae bacterium]|nr:hypothetical protein [Pyrinomonadaceae bacterium]
MEYGEKSRRLRERLKLAIPVRVRCRESADFEWDEMSRLIDVTPFGARFTLARLTETGRLLHLTMPMPRQLRCFDHVEPQYKVWSVVRHVREHRPADARPVARSEGVRFEIGVAFVGKHAPASFAHDPSTRYDVGALAPSECSYVLVERRPPPSPEEGAGGRPERKQETRLQVPVEVLVEVFDEQGATVEREQTVTENISRRGAAVWTTLGVERGRFVR